MDPLVLQILNIAITALTSIITVATPVVAVYIVTLLKSKIAQVEGQMPADRLAFVKLLCDEAVKAAEVAGANEFIASKEDYAVKWVQDYLTSKGLTFNVANIEGLVKSAFLSVIASSAPTVTVLGTTTEPTIRNMTLPAVKAPTPGASAPGLSDGSIATPPAVG